MTTVIYPANPDDGFQSYIGFSLEEMRNAPHSNQHSDGATEFDYLWYGIYHLGEETYELFRSFPMFVIDEPLPPDAKVIRVRLSRGTYFIAEDRVLYLFIDPDQVYPILPYVKENYDKTHYPIEVAKKEGGGSVVFHESALPLIESILKSGVDKIKLCLRSSSDVEGWGLTESANYMSSHENPTPSSLIVDWEIPVPKHTLTIQTTTGGTTEPIPGEYGIDEGNTVKVEAKPETGYNFSRWDLDGVSYTTNPISIIMNTDHLLTAHFSETPLPPPEKYNLTIEVTTGGTTTPEPSIYTYSVGEIVTVEAKANEGYKFKRFELDGEVKMENPVNVGMSADRALLAVFEVMVPPIQLWKVGAALSLVASGGTIAYFGLRKGGG